MKKQGIRTTKRRRKERKTDYKARLNLLKSHLPRIVIRKTNKYIIAQYIKSEMAQDRIVIGVSSASLLEHGWPEKMKGSLKSIPAAYLTGLLLGKNIQSKEKNKETTAIADIGLARSVKKSRIYAVLKGLVDTGVKINHKKEIFPEEKRIKGEHLKNKIEFEKIKNSIKKTLQFTTH